MAANEYKITTTRQDGETIISFKIPEGPAGDPAANVGDSDYQAWLNKGNEGTIEDYVSAIKGDEGDPRPLPLIGSTRVNAGTIDYTKIPVPLSRPLKEWEVKIAAPNRRWQGVGSGQRDRIAFTAPGLAWRRDYTADKVHYNEVKLEYIDRGDYVKFGGGTILMKGSVASNFNKVEYSWWACDDTQGRNEIEDSSTQVSSSRVGPLTELCFYAGYSEDPYPFQWGFSCWAGALIEVRGKEIEEDECAITINSALECSNSSLIVKKGEAYHNVFKLPAEGSTVTYCLTIGGENKDSYCSLNESATELTIDIPEITDNVIIDVRFTAYKTLSEDSVEDYFITTEAATVEVYRPLEGHPFYADHTGPSGYGYESLRTIDYSNAYASRVRYEYSGSSYFEIQGSYSFGYGGQGSTDYCALKVDRRDTDDEKRSFYQLDDGDPSGDSTTDEGYFTSLRVGVWGGGSCYFEMKSLKQDDGEYHIVYDVEVWPELETYDEEEGEYYGWFTPSFTSYPVTTLLEEDDDFGWQMVNTSHFNDRFEEELPRANPWEYTDNKAPLEKDIIGFKIPVLSNAKFIIDLKILDSWSIQRPLHYECYFPTERIEGEEIVISDTSRVSYCLKGSNNIEDTNDITQTSQGPLGLNIPLFSEDSTQKFVVDASRCPYLEEDGYFIIYFTKDPSKSNPIDH